MQYKLQYTHNLKGAQRKMNKKIIVVGADYAGLTAAALIADKGFDVTLYEKRAESQLDNNTVETLNPDMLALTGIGLPPNDKWLSCDDPVIYCPSLSKEFHRTVPEKKRNIKIDSKDLFEHILAFAKERPVDFRFGEAVIAPIIFGDRVAGVVTQSGKEDFADLVIDCAGLGSPIKKALPQSCGITKLCDTSYTYFTRTENPLGKCPDEKRRIIIFPGGQKVIADINAGIRFTDVKITAFEPFTKLQNSEVFDYLRQFNPSIGDDVIASSCRKAPSDAPELCPVCDGYAAAGFSAFMADPLSGETVTASLKAAKLLAKAVGKDRQCAFSKETLWQYNCDYFKVAGINYALLDCVKKALLSMSDDEIDSLFESGALNDSDFCADAERPFSGADINSLSLKLKAAKASPELFKKLAPFAAKAAAVRAILAAMPQKYNPSYFDLWQKSLKKAIG